MQHTQLSRRSAGVKSSDIDWEKQYLTFIPVVDTTFSWAQRATSGTLEYSTNDGQTWVTIANGESTPIITAGSKVIWRGNLKPHTTSSNGGIGSFSANGNYNAHGNTMSLLYYDNYYGSQLNSTAYKYAFYQLFYNDTYVLSAPILPATTLASFCYRFMFKGCTSLTTAPELPATTLASFCYRAMFSGCTSLTTAPELPATTLKSNCYMHMFSGCTKLNYLKALFTTTPSIDYTQSWVSGVAATGTFVKNRAATWTITGVDGIPEGWTVVDNS